MQRIGIAASKISQGCLIRYNVSVLLITLLCGALLFFVCGLAVLLAIGVLSLIMKWVLPQAGMPIVTLIKLCFFALSMVIALVIVFALLSNMRFKRSKL